MHSLSKLLQWRGVFFISFLSSSVGAEKSPWNAIIVTAIRDWHFHGFSFEQSRARERRQVKQRFHWLPVIIYRWSSFNCNVLSNVFASATVFLFWPNAKVGRFESLRPHLLIINVDSHLFFYVLQCYHPSPRYERFQIDWMNNRSIDHRLLLSLSFSFTPPIGKRLTGSLAMLEFH